MILLHFTTSYGHEVIQIYASMWRKYSWKSLYTTKLSKLQIRAFRDTFPKPAVKRLPAHHCPDHSVFLISDLISSDFLHPDLLPPFPIDQTQLKACCPGHQPPMAERGREGRNGSERSQWKVMGMPGHDSQGARTHPVVHISLHVGQAFTLGLNTHQR